MKSKKETIPEPAQLISFFESVIRLKSVKRAGWVSKVGIANAESVSDHTYSMCMMGMILSDIFGMDTERVTKMILIHDLAESIIGDFVPDKITREKKRTEERKAMKHILSKVPSVVRSNYEKLWQEYRSTKTPVSRFVHQLDKLEMAIQAVEYANQGYPQKTLLEFFGSAKRSMSTFNIDNEKLGSKDIILELLHDLEMNIVKQADRGKSAPR
ncbi:MAG TPA: HD domain-containing protein [Nitrososphaeraceae archaeon]|nr:HD domain-containing protein [Nitrososphaeraceae archaeon]